MAQEVELKLDLTHDAADELSKSALFSGSSSTARLESIYFDTPDHALAAAGMSLRIRRKGRARVQTVKAGRDESTGLFARSEWEQKVKNDTPVLDDTTPVQTLLGSQVNDLAPLFAVRVQRRTWNLDREAGAIELVIDHGEAVADDRHAVFDEVELELKNGTPPALFALAREIAAVFPVRLGVLSKSERGYRLLAVAESAAKAEPVMLDPTMTAAASLRQIANNCLRQFRLNEMLLLERPGAEAVHQARVALRRLRTALTIYRKMLADDRFGHFEREAHWLIGELSETRDLQVLIERTEPGPLRDKLELALTAAKSSLGTALQSDRARAFPLDLSEWLVAGPWTCDPAHAARRDRPVARVAAKALDRLHQHVKTRGRHLATIDAASRHHARKTAKKLRYTAEFFAPLFDSPDERHKCHHFIAELKKLQDQLGVLNDVAVAPAILDRLGLLGEPGASALIERDGKEADPRAAAHAYRHLVSAKRFWR